MYILLFTCLNIRAIHLELVNDMSIHSVIFALVQFFTLYEVPSHIYSDNARAFVAGGNLVKQVLCPMSLWKSLVFLTSNILPFLCIRLGLGASGCDL